MGRPLGRLARAEDQLEQRVLQSFDYVRAKPISPARFDFGKEWTPHFASGEAAAVALISQCERGGLGLGSFGSGATGAAYPQRSMPSKFVGVRASFSSSRARIPSLSTNRMQLEYITSEVNHGPR